ncbi:MAG: YncE family protein [Hydrotalea flava]|uniref:YncE family protein n=1 Tax=Hydrotalea TaxID=1004300 RepID=UPI0016A558D5|nr:MULTISPECIES: YncE family protein [Hydrotalea]MBY0346754.1 YncE family protein [Hydrotalea flava]NIM35314.1 YncE family protein [Hydrotalea flava]NIM38173.1 YncE family protein [Hydrotalea flava]NIN03337.1 YncE family protein [Hydrotalea flava]NIN15031.1 YncE family protein [Hydrotalea flava]
MNFPIVLNHRKNKFSVKLGGIVIAILFFFNLGMAQHTHLKVLKAYSIKSTGGWDYIAIHDATQRLFVSHGIQVNVLNAVSGDSIGIIPNTIGVHGVAFVNALNKGYTSNGRLNNVYVFNLNTLKVEDSIATGENPDAIFYNEITKKIYTCNGRSKDISVIDPFTNTVIATIPVGGKPETAVSDEKGNLYVNIEDKSEIVLIDGATNQVMHHWSIAPAEEPTGLVYDAATHTLFAGCGNKMMAVVDARNGIVKKMVPIGAGCDGVAFDKTWRQVYASNGQDGMLSIVSADTYAVLNTIPTMKTARTIAVSEKTHHIFLPAAAIDHKSVPGKRPAMLPGSFRVLLVGQE